MQRTLIFLAALLLPSAALSGGKYAAQDKELSAGNFTAANEQCKKAIETTVDWGSFEGSWDDSHSPDHAVAYCRSIADALYWECEDDEGRAAVTAALDGVRCIYDAAVTAESLGRKGAGLAVKDKVLEVRFNWQSTDLEDSTREWLARLLKGPDGSLSLWDHRAVKKSTGYYLGSGSFKWAEDTCGKTIPVEFGWQGFIDNFSGNANHDRVVNYCAPVFDALYNLCESPEGKAFVTDKVSKVRCVWDASATPDSLGRKGARLGLKEGLLEAGFNWDTTDISDTTRAWLMEQRK